MKSFFIFPVILFIVSVNCVTFDCNFQTIIWSGMSGMEAAYSCYAGVNLADDELSLKHVSGAHLDGKFLDDVIALSVYKIYCPFLPENITSFFTNLQLLRFYQTNMVSIIRQDLAPFTLLRFLLFGKNLIEVLPADLFKSNINLEKIDFNENRIKFVGYNLLSELTKLKSAFFAYNSCISREAYTTSQVAELQMKLLFDCPTQIAYESIESEFIDGEKLEKSVDDKLAERIEPLKLRLENVEHKIEEFEENVSNEIAQIYRVLNTINKLHFKL